MGCNIIILKGPWNVHIPTTLYSRHMLRHSRILKAKNSCPTKRLPGGGVQRVQI